jgi:integrase
VLLLRCWFFGETAGESIMAWLEKRGDGFRLCFRFSGQKFTRSLLTEDSRSANGALARLEDNLRRVELGTLEIPDTVDLATFLLSDGRTTQRPSLPKKLTLGELFTAYFSHLPEGALEWYTISSMKTHEGQLKRHFGESFLIRNLSLPDLQSYVESRSKEKGRTGQPLRPTTLKRAIVTLRTVWNWALRSVLLDRPFPGKGLRFPKTTEKPPFQTLADVEERVKGLTPVQASELWECAFLTTADVAALLQHVQQHARHPFVYPMFCFAAHTGARRSEMIRSKLVDLDFKAGLITIHERKKCHEKRTIRRLPMSPLLKSALSIWIANHPGGEFTFCQQAHVPRSRTRKGHSSGALTDNEAHNHFERALLGTRWENLRGWHVFRHSFCSNCAAAGIDQRIINTWVGHQTDEMVRRYRHLIPNQEQAAIRSVFGPE